MSRLCLYLICFFPMGSVYDSFGMSKLFGFNVMNLAKYNKIATNNKPPLSIKSYNSEKNKKTINAELHRLLAEAKDTLFWDNERLLKKQELILGCANILDKITQGKRYIIDLENETVQELEEFNNDSSNMAKASSNDDVIAFIEYKLHKVILTDSRFVPLESLEEYIESKKST